jgi:mannose-6-phosphate isomerase-like protein (cupin superfamily)
LVAYSSTTIDDLGEEPFRKVRRALGITAFGANALVLPPGGVGRPHYHDLQDELYFVHRGRAIFDFPDERIELGPGGLVHVEATTPRRVTNPGPDELVILIVGGKDGYVGRDGSPRTPSPSSATPARIKNVGNPGPTWGNPWFPTDPLLARGIGGRAGTEPA